MPIWVRLILAAVFFTGSASAGQAKVHITVDLSRQTMHVVSANETFDWKVSTGKFGFETPDGTYGVLWMDKDHLSQEYDNAPMPDAIFFRPGFAIHGAYKSAFGHPASHGCVRLPVDKAEILFGLVQAEGAEIKIVGGQQIETAATTTVTPRHRHPAPDEDAMPDVYQNLMAQPRPGTGPTDLQSGYLRSPY